MALVAKLFREQQMDTSVAHVMEAVRLSQSLAALRNLSKAGLEELNEATLSVLCMGESIMLSLVNEQLIISDRIGNANETSSSPLQLDIERSQKNFDCPPQQNKKNLRLTFAKKPTWKEASSCTGLLVGVEMGKPVFHFRKKEHLRNCGHSQWDPAFSIDIIEKGTWGNTVEEAASKFVINQAALSDELRVVCALLEQSIPASIPAAVKALITSINNLAATSDDAVQLMEVIPSLVSVSRYGNVRNTDT